MNVARASVVIIIINKFLFCYPNCFILLIKDVVKSRNTLLRYSNRTDAFKADTCESMSSVWTIWGDNKDRKTVDEHWRSPQCI